MRGRDPERLPIDDAIPRLQQALRSGTSAVLVAPPGAGKTTRVPIALLEEPWLAGSRILMLEPRRLAARAAAHYMAQLLGERVGETVGYRVRMDSRVGPRTRVEVITEGVLTRMLADDPTLEGVQLVIFDEFHERSLHADVGLALTLRSRELLRDDLRLLVMSATLDVRRVCALLGDPPQVVSEGKLHPVATHYMPPRNQAAREMAVVAAVERALRDDPGDVLVFLPGASEIKRVELLLNERALPTGTYVAPLHGALALDDQDRAIQPSPLGMRKVVLATTIAQTSLTIDGVRVVIDGGLTRIPRYSIRSGMTRLETVPVSRAAADQRRGRAGRIAPGVCYRLWDEAQNGVLREHDIPEILEADLTSLVLDLAAAGVHDVNELRWLDPPPAGAVAQARELLCELEATDASGTITPHGASISALGTHPRMAHMLHRARDLEHGDVAADIAAILEERDFIVGAPVDRDPDVRTRIGLLRGERSAHAVDRAALQRTRSTAQRWHERVAARSGTGSLDAVGKTLAFAYPDRIAQRRPGPTPRYVLRNGVGAVLPPGSQLHNEEFLVVAQLDGRLPESLILLAAPIAREDIEREFADQIVRRDSVSWSDTAQAVLARRKRTLGSITLSDDPLAEPNAVEVQHVVRDAIAAS
ncbi:MAG: ATP-dependent helicase HrpB, partial [Gemmatimonadota bacterium]